MARTSISSVPVSQIITWFGQRKDEVILGTEARLSGPPGFRYIARCRRCRATMKSQMVGQAFAWGDTDDPNRAIRALRYAYLSHIERHHGERHARAIDSLDS